MMMKHSDNRITIPFFPVLLLMFFAALPLVAQNAKLDARLRQVVKHHAATIKKERARADVVPTVNVLIKTEDGKASSLQQELSGIGIRSQAVNQDAVTAKIPVNRLEDVAQSRYVSSVHHSRKFRLMNDKTRQVSQVNPIHNGVDLSTPFTGKDVIVAVVDEGFEYNHAAFQHADGSSRLLSVWDQMQEGGVPGQMPSDPSDSFPDANGHATHVAGTAAGSVISGLDYHGMAPDADLVFVSSDFDLTNILNALYYIDTLAAKAGKPWVANFSFGGHDGPHDGTDFYSETVNGFLGAGKLLAAAMGNENDEKLHTSYDFENAGDTIEILVRKSSYGIYINLWCNAADSTEYFKFRPYLYLNGKKDYKTDSYWEDYYFTEVESSSRKQVMGIAFEYDDVPGSNYVGVEVVSLKPGGFNCWLDAESGVYVTQQSNRFLSGNNQYLVAEGGATIHRAIAVASYNARNKLTNINGSSLSYTYNYPLGQISKFSNAGPSLYDEVIPKPTVAAPGVVAVSAMNKYSDYFSGTGNSIIAKTTRNGESYYYSHKSGTSMATPVVAGILALWLQAFPTMTPEHANEILAATAMQDSYTTDKNYWGYGKINAYEGLKKAIQMNDSILSGFSHLPYEVAHTPTMLFTPDHLRILWADKAPHAVVEIFDVTGKRLVSCRLGRHGAGEEATIDVANLNKGVYIVNIHTPFATISRKFRK